MDKADQVNLRKEARRLQELYRGRFSESEAFLLITKKGGTEHAVDFINTAEPQKVRKYLMKCDKNQIVDLQKDATDVAEKLIKGIQSSVRQFGCGDCDNAWWRRVPTRKEVSKCKMCRRKFDPVPRQHEWGWARFQCDCGHQFSGYGQMGQLVSPCYRCGANCKPYGIIPPDGRRGRRPRGRQQHACSGVNCQHRYVAPIPPVEVVAPPTGHVVDVIVQHHDHHGDDNEEEPTGDNSGYGDECVHPSVSSRRVKYPSQLHTSTGSTVNTFLTQPDNDEIDLESFSTLPTIDEDLSNIDED